MKDDTCVRFLQWALPNLHLSWPGFRKVRKQVCKRLDRRIQEVGLPDIDTYQTYLCDHDSEWQVLDGFCRITISQFYRDQRVFEFLGSEILPALVRRAEERGDKTIRCWSAGCASGEEAYTLALQWTFLLAPLCPGIDMEIVATDADRSMLDRARKACYPLSSLKALPAPWLQSAFDRSEKNYFLHRRITNRVKYFEQDIRQSTPPGFFHLIFCRNLAFTYFDLGLQQKVLARIKKALIPGGALTVGAHESLPGGVVGLSLWKAAMPIYRKTTL